MIAKPVVPREVAARDVEAVIDAYLGEASVDIALGFVDALETAYRHIGRQPAAGSPRYGQALNLAGLRSWPLTRCPHLVFYFEHADVVDIWRVLHGQRDVPSSLHADFSDPGA